MYRNVAECNFSSVKPAFLAFHVSLDRINLPMKGFLGWFSDNFGLYPLFRIRIRNNKVILILILRTSRPRLVWLPPPTMSDNHTDDNGPAGNAGGKDGLKVTKLLGNDSSVYCTHKKCMGLVWTCRHWTHLALLHLLVTVIS